ARGRGRNRAAPAARNRDAQGARADRGAGDRPAAPGSAEGRRGDRDRASPAGRTSGQIRGRTAVTDPAPDWRLTLQRPTVVAAACFGVWTAGIEAKLVYLQVYRHADLVVRASKQQMRTIDLPAKRGDIVDRKGRVLATSVDAESIYAVPSDIADADAVVRK